MVIGGYYTYRGEHLVMYIIIELLGCTSETNIILNINYIPTKKKKKGWILWYVNYISIKQRKCELYSWVGWELMKEFKQSGDMVGFILLEDYSGYSEKSGLKGATLEAGIPLIGR